MTLKMRLDEPGVISVSSQVFKTQTIAVKLLDCWLIVPFKLNQTVFFTY